MMVMTKKNIYISTIGALLVLLIFGSQVKTAENNSIIKSLDEQINDILFVHYLSRFNHQDLISYGLTCHRNNNYLYATAEKRKKHLSSLIIPRISWNSFQWHKYGSRADCRKVVENPLGNMTQQSLIISRIELLDEGRIDHHHGAWDNFAGELLDNPIPFLDSQRHLYAIGYGWSWVQKNSNEAKAKNIICYKATHEIQTGPSRDGKVLENRYPCALQFSTNDGKSSSIMLIAMANFPHLLKAILNSTKKEKIAITEGKNSRYVVKRSYQYKLAGVTLPLNYTESILQESSSTSYSSFSLLPGDLKAALEKRYKEQQENKSS